MREPAVLSSSDIDFCRWLTDRIEAAASVLDDIHGCQVMYEPGYHQKRKDIAHEAVVSLLLKDVKRLGQELRGAGEKRRRSAEKKLAAGAAVSSLGDRELLELALAKGFRLNGSMTGGA